jgi:hypothetical protein
MSTVDFSTVFGGVTLVSTAVRRGTVVGATRNGGNVTGKSIDGGTAQKLGKGDFFAPVFWWLLPERADGANSTRQR